MDRFLLEAQNSFLRNAIDSHEEFDQLAREAEATFSGIARANPFGDVQLRGADLQGEAEAPAEVSSQQLRGADLRRRVGAPAAIGSQQMRDADLRGGSASRSAVSRLRLVLQLPLEDLQLANAEGRCRLVLPLLEAKYHQFRFRSTSCKLLPRAAATAALRSQFISVRVRNGLLLPSAT